ncbi:MAG: 16S rRNA (uracil(1498)-N(3))-methyltransferase [Myxococcota bacterium]|nr:16S rRNA (uracil(1498)-N(3))-methyltransferase [Myxococcota bacterium]
MNLLLVEPDEVSSDGTALLRGRRVKHAREVLAASAGDSLRVGLRDGRLGTATVLSLSPEALHLAITLGEAPPPRAEIDLLLAIPRPKALKKVLPAVASLGVDRIFLVNAARVEKSYFDSKVLAGEFVQELLSQGLEQARDTVAPRVELRERFRPFVEDEVRALAPGATCLLAHPTSAARLQDVAPKTGRTLLAIGPEGGWVPFEVELLEKAGFQGFSLGPRILRVEVAVPFLLGSLAALRGSQA